ncbi:uncharacterized protein LOC143353510 [Halictus rubicundus]|uniref:uncharacterized protein LOC143353510 n=1 Tax=Halictus rubicundus TaxID=77578 RepID=UPI004034FDD5
MLPRYRRSISHGRRASCCRTVIEKMGVIEKEYKTYCFLLRMMSLWPFENSTSTKIRRILLPLVPLTSIMIQIFLIPPGLTFKNILMVLTFGLPMLLFFCRYVGIIYTFPTIRFIFENLQSDYNLLQNPVEVEILLQRAYSSRRVVHAFVCIAIMATLYGHVIICGPIILDLLMPMNETRPHVLYSFGFFAQGRLSVYLVSLSLLATIITGVITIICSESTLFVVSQYCCGLFEIANYRFQSLIDASVRETDESRQRYLMKASVREAVEIHTKAIDFVRMFGYDARIPYLIAIVVVVVSMSLNLFRSILAILEMEDLKELCISFFFGIFHIMAVFMGNYIGQEVIDNSVAISYDTYNSLWYSSPVKMQKMILLIMQRSSVGTMLDFSGLFIPSNKGFATMMSSSFSYFTTICSLRGNPS